MHIGTFLLTSSIYHFYILGEDASSYVAPTEGTVRIPNTLTNIVGGFLVGIGTKLGNGCTSGHGICGLARFSKRSFVAVITFMCTGIISGLFFDKLEIFSASDDDLSWIPNGISTPFAISFVFLFTLGAAFTLYFDDAKDRDSDASETELRNDYYVDFGGNDIEDCTSRMKEDEESQSTFDILKSYSTFESSRVVDSESLREDLKDDSEIDVIEDHISTKQDHDLQPRCNIGLRKNIFGALSGILFALGLAISGMIKQYKVISFLDIVSIENWDPSLAFVMAGGLVISFASYQYVKDHGIISNQRAMTCPPLLGEECSFNVPTRTAIDAKLVIGASLFGIGWGIAGYCPGPALYAFAAGMPKEMAYWWPSNIIGTILGEILSSYF